MTLSLLTSPDGQWCAVRRGKQTAWYPLGAASGERLGEPVARVELPEPTTELVLLGPEKAAGAMTAMTLTRAGETTLLGLLQPPKLERVADLTLSGRWSVATVTGSRAALLAADARTCTVVRAAGRSLVAQVLDPAGLIELVLGMDRQQLAIATTRKLELWDAVSGRPLTRLQLQLPPPPRIVGTAAGHWWILRPEQQQILLLRLSDGRPFLHGIGAPVRAVVSHPASPWLVVVTQQGLLRLSCFAHAVAPLEAPAAEAYAIAPAGDEAVLLGANGFAQAPWLMRLSASAAATGVPRVKSPVVVSTSTLGAAAVLPAPGAANAASATGAGGTAAEQLRVLRQRAEGGAAGRDAGGELAADDAAASDADSITNSVIVDAIAPFDDAGDAASEVDAAALPEGVDAAAYDASVFDEDPDDAILSDGAARRAWAAGGAAASSSKVISSGASGSGGALDAPALSWATRRPKRTFSDEAPPSGADAGASPGGATAAGSSDDAAAAAEHSDAEMAARHRPSVLDALLDDPDDEEDDVDDDEAASGAHDPSADEAARFGATRDEAPAASGDARSERARRRAAARGELLEGEFADAAPDDSAPAAGSEPFAVVTGDESALSEDERALLRALGGTGPIDAGELEATDPTGAGGAARAAEAPEGAGSSTAAEGSTDPGAAFAAAPASPAGRGPGSRPAAWAPARPGTAAGASATPRSVPWLPAGGAAAGPGAIPPGTLPGRRAAWPPTGGRAGSRPAGAMRSGSTAVAASGAASASGASAAASASRAPSGTAGGAGASGSASSGAAPGPSAGTSAGASSGTSGDPSSGAPGAAEAASPSASASAAPVSGANVAGSSATASTSPGKAPRAVPAWAGGGTSSSAASAPSAASASPGPAASSSSATSSGGRPPASSPGQPRAAAAPPPRAAPPGPPRAGGAPPPTRGSAIPALLGHDPNAREDAARGPWRAELARFGGELGRGALELPPTVTSSELAILARRLSLPEPARQASIILYAAWLAGAPFVPMTQLAAILGEAGWSEGWNEALGIGALGQLGLLRHREGQVALRRPVADALDGRPWGAIRIAGEPAASPVMIPGRLGRIEVAAWPAWHNYLGKVALVTGSLRRALVEARLAELVAVTFEPLAEYPSPWPAGTNLLVVTDTIGGLTELLPELRVTPT